MTAVGFVSPYRTNVQVFINRRKGIAHSPLVPFSLSKCFLNFKANHSINDDESKRHSEMSAVKILFICL